MITPPFDKGFRTIVIRYDGSLDMLIQECLEPIALDFDLMKNSWFLRYWETGPSVRWRIDAKSNSDTKLRQITTRLRDEVRSLPAAESWTAEQYESVAKLLAGRENMDSYAHFVPSGEVWVDHYIPETEKYGKGEILELAHEHFVSSSQIALKLMRLKMGQKEKIALTALMLATEHIVTGEPLTQHRWLPPKVEPEVALWEGIFNLESLKKCSATGEGVSRQASEIVPLWSKAVDDYRRRMAQRDLTSLERDPLDIFRHLFMNRLGLDLYGEWIARQLAEEIRQ